MKKDNLNRNKKKDVWQTLYLFFKKPTVILCSVVGLILLLSVTFHWENKSRIISNKDVTSNFSNLVEKNISLIEKKSCPTESQCLEVSITIPITQKEWLNQDLRNLVTSEHGKSLSLEQLKAELENEYKKEIADFNPDESNGYVHIEHITFDGLSNSIATFKRDGYLYSGGAHGMPLQHYYNYNLINHELLTIRNIVLPNKEEALNKALFEVYKKYSASNEIDPIEFKDFSAPDSFRFLPNGSMEFIFPPYEIGPYSAGYIPLTLPAESLNGIINPAVLKLQQQNN